MMDETPGAPSTSAAAVADSASAAATNKITAATATTTKLLIKASNQQFDDQMIECDLLWTVKRLKIQLSTAYPSKPPVADQKLIYSGQLLIDTLQLKDVIRSYKDVYTQHHIFHLVYTPKNAPATQKPKTAAIINNTMSTSINTNQTAVDGLRHRHSANAQQTQQQQQQQYPQMPHYPQFIPQMPMAQTSQCSVRYDQRSHDNNAAMQLGYPGQLSITDMTTHQAAMYNWMHQVYSQYMDQCTRLFNATTATSDATGAARDATVPAHSQNSLLFLQQQLPFIAPNTNVFAATGTNFTMPQSPLMATISSFQSATAHTEPQAQASVNTQAAAERSEVEVNLPQQQQQPQPQAAPARFPNIVQDEQDNRDWLDSFFSITRLAIFLTILYFNSSPLRCLVVVIIAGGIYLYHIGVLRLRNERNNNNLNRDNNIAAAAVAADVEVDQPLQGVQEDVQPQEDANIPPDVAAAQVPLLPENPNTTAENGVIPAPPGDENDNNNSTSVISFIRTFVVTFFTSLLPETPAL